MENQNNYNLHLDQNRPRPNSSQEQKPVLHHDEDEIDLRNYLRTIWKRRTTIISIFLVAVILGGLLTYFVLPKIYETTSILRIGKISGEHIETPEQTEVIISTLTVSREIMRRLDLLELPKKSKTPEEIRITNKIDDFLKVKTAASTPERALALNEITSEIIIERHTDLATQAQLALKENIEQIQKQIKDTEIAIAEMLKKMETVNQEADNILKKVEELEKASTEGQGRVVQGYLSAWQDTKARIENEQIKHDQLKNKLETLKITLRNKQTEQVYQEQPTGIEVEPALASGPVKPNKQLNWVITIIIAFFVSIIYGFMAEYFSKGKIN